MKRLILPLLAAITLPTAVSAETWYLLAKHKKLLSFCNQRESEKEQSLLILKVITMFPAYICIKGKIED